MNAYHCSHTRNVKLVDHRAEPEQTEGVTCLTRLAWEHLEIPQEGLENVTGER